MDGLLQVFNLGLFVASTAHVLDGVPEVKVQPLISDEIPDLN
jgi:hypothetical protein